VTIPLDAIDPDAGYRRWTERYLWHIDQLPLIVQTTGVLVMPHLRAVKIQERVSGGGYIDNIPVVDGPGTRDAVAAWAALRAYLDCAAVHLDVERLSIPFELPEDVDSARWWAHEARAWLARVVDRIRAWPDLVELEETLFALIRRVSGRQPDVQDPAPTVMDLCEVCGQEAVLVDWIEGPDGTSMLAKACTVCGTKYAGGP
jgi:hypothetical protein